MRIIDITGKIVDGMWNYDNPFPMFRLKPIGDMPWLPNKVYSHIFEGMHSQSGTYLETPAHYYGFKKSYTVADIPVSKLIDMPCRVLSLEGFTAEGTNRKKRIDVHDLEKCCAGYDFPSGVSILIATGWSDYWMEDCFVQESPFFTYDAMHWIISKKPILLGSDFPCWDNSENTQGFFDDFFKSDILMLAPCVNLRQAGRCDSLLTVMPINVMGTSNAPCRAFLKTEQS